MGQAYFVCHIVYTHLHAVHVKSTRTVILTALLCWMFYRDGAGNTGVVRFLSVCTCCMRVTSHFLHRRVHISKSTLDSMKLHVNDSSLNAKYIISDGDGASRDDYLRKHNVTTYFVEPQASAAMSTC